MPMLLLPTEPVIQHVSVQTCNAAAAVHVDHSEQLQLGRQPLSKLSFTFIGKLNDRFLSVESQYIILDWSMAQVKM